MSNSAKNALSQMKEALEGKVRQIDQVDVKEKKLYDVVDERKYAKMVAERRKKGDFVEDDGDLGYNDDGEENLNVYEDNNDDTVIEGSNDGNVDSSNIGSRNFTGGSISKMSATLSKATVGSLKEKIDLNSLTRSKGRGGDDEIDNLLNELDDVPEPVVDVRVVTKPVVKAPIVAPVEHVSVGIAPYSNSPQLSTVTSVSPATASPMVMKEEKVTPVKSRIQLAQEERQRLFRERVLGSSAVTPTSNAARAKISPTQMLPSFNASPTSLSPAQNLATVANTNFSDSLEVQRPSIQGLQLERVLDNRASYKYLQKKQKYLALQSKSDSIEVENFDFDIDAPIPEDTERSSLLFYWLDIQEDSLRQPGKLFLFGKAMTNEAAVMRAVNRNARTEMYKLLLGKAKAGNSNISIPLDVLESEAATATVPVPAASFVSVCAEVQNMQRSLLVVPREVTPGGEVVTPEALFNELRDHLMAGLVPATSSQGEGGFAAKAVERSYAFELAGVPRHRAEYIKISYPAQYPAPARSRLEGETYSHVFGSTSSMTEAFLLKRRLKGPGWVRLLDPQITALNGAPVSTNSSQNASLARLNSNCVVEVAVQSPKLVQVLDVQGVTAISNATVDNFRQLLSEGAAAALDSGRAVVQGGLLSVPPSPQLTVVSLSTKVAPSSSSPSEAVKDVVKDEKKEKEKESIQNNSILMVSLLTHSAVSLEAPFLDTADQVQTLVLMRADCGSPPAFRRLLEEKKHHFVRVYPSEQALLEALLAHLYHTDPDVLCGHNISGFDLDLIMGRVLALGVADFSRLARMRRGSPPRASHSIFGHSFGAALTAGRLVADTYVGARELVREVSFGLTHLSEVILKTQREDLFVNASDVQVLLGESSGAGSVRLAQAAANDALLSLQLLNQLQLLPLTNQLTSLAGNLLSRSLRGARAERIEYLLLHEFYRLKYILPDKVKFDFGEKPADSRAPRPKKARKSLTDDAAKEEKESARRIEDEEDAIVNPEEEEDADVTAAAGPMMGVTGVAARGAKKRQKAAYAGGLVLEPKKGLYNNNILLLDFQSLYPSIIQEFNICFTTVQRKLITNDEANAAAPARRRRRPAGADLDEDEDEMEAADLEGEELPPLPEKVPLERMAVLPRIIRSLVMQRRAVKALIKGETEERKRTQLDIRQKALKILANSLYGCLGFQHSRFFARALAALVTAQGRRILESTKSIVEGTLSLEVIYGDTDSVMINTGRADVLHAYEVGRRVQREVNKLYTHLEIEIDNVFQSLLLLKKKKYAALLAPPPHAIQPNVPIDVHALKREVKGLDMVRRDWCPLSKEASARVLDILLRSSISQLSASNASSHIANDLTNSQLSTGAQPAAAQDDVDPMLLVTNTIRALLDESANLVREMRIPVNAFVITKGMNKPPEAYPDYRTMPHLMVAVRMRRRGMRVNVGDHIPYVICKENVNSVDLFSDKAGKVSSPSSSLSQSQSHSQSPEAKTSPQTPDGKSGPDVVSAQLYSSPSQSSPVSQLSFTQSPTQSSPTQSSPTQSPNTPSTPSAGASTSGSISQRAYHPQELLMHPDILHIDAEWYLSQQILPPIARLCEPLSEIGLSPKSLSEALGLSFTSTTASSTWNAMDDFLTSTDFTPRSSKSDAERFGKIPGVELACHQCKQRRFVDAVFTQRRPGPRLNPFEPFCFSLRCLEPGCNGYLGGARASAACAALQNKLQMLLRHTLGRMQQGWLKCEDPLCALRTRTQPLGRDCRCPAPGCRAALRPEISAEALHTLMRFVTCAFDVKRAVENIRKDVYESIKRNGSQLSEEQKNNLVARIPEPKPDADAHQIASRNGTVEIAELDLKQKFPIFAEEAEGLKNVVTMGNQFLESNAYNFVSLQAIFPRIK